MTIEQQRRLPLEPGAWTLDRPHTTVGFTARHMGISKVRGQFRDFDATVEIGDTLETISLVAEVQMASVDTDSPDRDGHLRSSDFFAIDEHPTMRFRSTSIRRLDEDTFELEGDLTIRGVTRNETFTLRFDGLETFPGDGSLHAGFTATAAIDRTDYGVDFNVPLGAGGFVVSNRIDIELDAQLMVTE